LKFRVINGIAYYDTILSEKRNQELLNLLRDEDKKKLLTSSTLTKNYLDGVLAEIVIPRETLGNMLKALYTSEENIRTLISKCKFIMGV
jgi:Mg2+/Co2+ transporter CorC